MKTINRILMVVLVSLPVCGFSQPGLEVRYWYAAGDQPDSYIFGYDGAVFQNGSKSAFIEAAEDSIDGFGTLMQTCSANEYLGTQIRMTGYVKAEDVSGWAGMWLRVDARSERKMLSFDNMQDRPVRGHADWTECVIVLDVPAESGTLNYGVLMGGTGKIWFDNVSFEIVDNLTEEDIRDLGGWPPPIKPANLDFEE